VIARSVSPFLVAVAASLGASNAMCSRPAPQADASAMATYNATGVVRAVDGDKKTILVAHEEVVGYMKAMTMQFDLRDAAQAKGIAAGDRIQFTFSDDGQGHLVVESLRKAS
jgi:Cu/Ag efflux protein CusF